MSMIQRDETGTIWQYHILSSLKNNSKPSECMPGKIILIEVTEGTHLQPTATNVLSISFQNETFRNEKINYQNLVTYFNFQQPNFIILLCSYYPIACFPTSKPFTAGILGSPQRSESKTAAGSERCQTGLVMWVFLCL